LLDKPSAHRRITRHRFRLLLGNLKGMVRLAISQSAMLRSTSAVGALGHVVGALVNYGRAIAKNDLDNMSDPFQEKVLQKLRVICRSSQPHTKEFEHAALYV
jgi:hypothetical protein